MLRFGVFLGGWLFGCNIVYVEFFGVEICGLLWFCLEVREV